MNISLRASANGVAAMLCVIGVWLWTWRHLAIEWHYNEQYAFGYAVPWLAGFLAWQRLRSPSGEDLDTTFADQAGPRWLVLSWLAVPLFLLAELLRRQDPTWRLVDWLLASAATLLTAGWLGQVGGRALLRMMAFPLAFLWFAVPWPSMVETPLTLGLLQAVTQVTADMLSWAGIAALQRGNTIELRNCIVGVDIACSGVQSFQAMVMATLFLGETFRLHPVRRAALLAGGALTAFAVNLVRVFALSRVASREGEGALDRMHDTIGALATATMVVVVIFLAWLLVRRNGRDVVPAAPPRWPPWRLRGANGLALLAAFALVPLAARAWFRVGIGNPSVEQKTRLWSVKTTGLPDGWRAKPDRFTPTEVHLLRFSEATAVDFRSPDLGEAHVLHLFWAPEATVPSQSFSHTPETCLPSAGWQRIGQPIPTTVNIGDIPIHGALFQFAQDGQRQSVFHATWYGGQSRPYGGPLESIGHRGGRFALLWRAPARLGHESLTVYVASQGRHDTGGARVAQVMQTVLEANRGGAVSQTKRE